MSAHCVSHLHLHRLSGCRWTGRAGSCSQKFELVLPLHDAYGPGCLLHPPACLPACSSVWPFAGKFYTGRVAAATKNPEEEVWWQSMQLTIDSYGMIQKARVDPDLFGVRPDELMGQSVAFCIDVFRAMVSGDPPLPPCL